VQDSLGRLPTSRSKNSALIFARIFALAILAIGSSACGPSKPQTPAEKGRIVYMTNCVVCHNPNPNLAGSQGPPIAGSSRELIEDRVLYLKYPPDYKPKRNTHAMRAMPFLKNQIDNLYAFLQEAAQQQPATAAK
jgi:mono/diheme cytochrome c family protein